MKDFRGLTVWQKAHALVLAIYRASAAFPKHEVYGVSSQLRRATCSVPTNLAEGCGRGSDADFARFVQLAMGSACEVEHLLLLASDLGYFNDPTSPRLAEDVIQIKRMLTALLKKLRG